VEGTDRDCIVSVWGEESGDEVQKSWCRSDQRLVIGWSGSSTSGDGEGVDRCCSQQREAERRCDDNCVMKQHQVCRVVMMSVGRRRGW
jgi:hypothetical protein